jgi:hypothetical protein
VAVSHAAATTGLRSENALLAGNRFKRKILEAFLTIHDAVDPRGHTSVRGLPIDDPLREIMPRILENHFGIAFVPTSAV